MNALEGRRIVITRPVDKAEEFSSVLKELGASISMISWALLIMIR